MKRPARPDWTPPLPVAEPGWNGSRDEYCSPVEGRTGGELWADDRGVYVHESAACRNVEVRECPHAGQSLYFNDGTGWQPLLISSLSSAHVLDLVGVFSTGVAAFRGRQRDLVFVEDDRASQVLSFAMNGDPIAAFQAVTADVIYLSVPSEAEDPFPTSTLYALTPERSTHLGAFDGASWESFETSLQNRIEQLWGAGGVGPSTRCS